MESGVNSVMSHLQGKKILLMIFPFYDYADRIKQELETQGAEVLLILNRWPKESFRFSTNWVLTLFFYLKNPFFKQIFTKQVIEEVGNQKFDLLLSIGGFSASKKLIKRLKKNNPEISTRIFFWDSFYYWKIANQRKWFDKSFSFDPVDCRKYPDLIYQPDFYIGSHVDTHEYKYNISHIGASHIFALNRIPILCKLQKHLNARSQSNYLIAVEPNNPDTLKFLLLSLTSLRWFKYRQIIKYYKKEDTVMISSRIPYEDVVEIESHSRCIVDIPPEKQTGMTIRALEALAAGKKLITTNKYVKEAPFYNPKNIVILDTEHPYVDDDFIYSANEKVDIEYLRIDNWLKTILC